MSRCGARNAFWFASLCACGAGGGGTAAHDASIGVDVLDVQIAREVSVPPRGACVIPPPAPTDAQTIGDGTGASCSEAVMRAAVTRGGNLRLNCGRGFVLALTSPLSVTRDVEIDGQGEVTFSGRSQNRILLMMGDHNAQTPSLVLRSLRFIDGMSGGDGSDPNQGGGAVMRFGGSLTIINSQFHNNVAPSSGQDVAGGAVYARGGGRTAIFSSTFSNNRASNGGAVGQLGGSGLLLVQTTFASNQATGTGGNPGRGGNGGAVYLDGNDVPLTICATRMLQNRARAYGGGVFRVGYSVRDAVQISESVVDGNLIESGHQSLGGGLYLQNMPVAIDRTSIVRNESWGAGGIFLAGVTATLENVTIAENIARDSLGGGMSIEATTGELNNVTLARNRAASSVAFGSAIHGGGLRLRNTIVEGNVSGNGWNPNSCTRVHTSGGGNWQFPVLREGGSDAPAQLCVADARLVSAMLAPTLTGEMPVLVPLGGSPVIGGGSGCPALDQLGRTRNGACTSGAVIP